MNGIQLNLTASGGYYDSTEANATKIEVFDGEELIAKSKEILTAQAASGANDSNNAGGYASTFSFDGLILETDKTYTFKFVAESGDPAYYLWSKKVDDNNSGVGYTGGSSDYLPWIRLNVTAVPEPSAFGLLAGLSALLFVGTRRRK